MGMTRFAAGDVSCHWYRSGRVRSGPRPTLTLASAGAYVSEFLRTKKYGIGMRQRQRQRVRIGMRLRGAEDKEKESACALRKKRRNWHVRSAEGKRAGIGCVARLGQRVGSVCAYAALHS